MLPATSYFLILATSVAGLLDISWSVAGLSGALLSVVSLVEQRRYHFRLAALGVSSSYQRALMSDIGTSMIAGVAAYGLGKFIFAMAKIAS